ncbi:hypothetical protein D3C76_1627400 [compost metagenome]
MGTVEEPGVPVVGEGAVSESVTSILAPKLVNPFSTPGDCTLITAVVVSVTLGS